MQVHVLLVTQKAAPELARALEAAAAACGASCCRPCHGQPLLASASTAQDRKQLLTHLHAGTLACAGSGSAHASQCCADARLCCLLSSGSLQACCCLTSAGSQPSSKHSWPAWLQEAMRMRQLALRAQLALAPPYGPRVRRQQMLALHAHRCLQQVVLASVLTVLLRHGLCAVLQAQPPLARAMTLVLLYQWDHAGPDVAVDKASLCHERLQASRICSD